VKFGGLTFQPAKDLGQGFENLCSPAIETIDDRFNYSEVRWTALGFIGNRLHVLTYTVRGENIRLISLRKANKREREYYEEKT